MKERDRIAGEKLRQEQGRKRETDREREGRKGGRKIQTSVSEYLKVIFKFECL